STSKSKKKNKKKKGGGGPKLDTNAAVATANGSKPEADVEAYGGEGDDDELESPTVIRLKSAPEDTQDDDAENDSPVPTPQPNGVRKTATAPNQIETPSGSEEQLDTLIKERESLRAEVSELRKSLESIKEKHDGEVKGLTESLEESQSGKEHWEAQYRNLMGKVNTIRSQLGERLKSDAEDLAQARARIEELEEQNRGTSETNKSLEEQLEQLRAQYQAQSQEVLNLRSRATLSQQNWIKERDELVQREAYAKEEFETAKQAMQDWEVLAMEERSLRESLGDRVAELEEQLSNQREAYERASSERDSQSSTVDKLQSALQVIQDERKKELRELVENSQKAMDEMRKQLQAAEEAASSAKTDLESTRKELERALPFEKEVKEKNLLIGKLRHEAVILNEHLTKALRFLKKGKPEDNVDRRVVTNHFLRFLALDRSDPKKFQILQLIAALLAWTDEEREQAGLARPGASNATLRIPISPFRRTPSTPSLNADALLASEGGSSKETLAELWSDFLERESQQSESSRRGSAMSPASESGRKSNTGLGLS
ncbi:hypothetical protein M501DRAFT_930446, partial [Patellaria atrata CBS 101060]